MPRMNLGFDEETYRHILLIQKVNRLRKREDVIKLLLKVYVRGKPEKLCPYPMPCEGENGELCGWVDGDTPEGELKCVYNFEDNF